MSFITKNLKQTAVYWANPVQVGDGRITFDDGAEINVRWEERQELFVDSFGNERQSQAIVYVEDEVVVGEYLFLGDLDDLASDLSDPDEVDSFEIKAVKKSPNISGEIFERKVFL